MSIFDALEIASSGMSTQRTRMNVASMNMANEDTTRTAEGGPYRRRDVVVASADVSSRTFAQRLAQAVNGSEPDYLGVTVSEVRETDEPFKQIYDPGHPDADANGYVALPAIESVSEMMNLMGAARAYEAQTNVIRTVKQMAEQAIRLGK
jgi:flagellar basal-body rod protein FlgC